MIKVIFPNGHCIITDAPRSAFAGKDCKIEESDYCGLLDYSYLDPLHRRR